MIILALTQHCAFINYLHPQDDPSSTDDDEISDDEISDDEPAAEKGDIVAVVEHDSTQAEPKIHLGKVVRIRNQEVDLAWLRPQQPEGGGEYKMCVGETWTESTDSLVFPIDVKYDACTGLYSLRTCPTDIHNYVFN